jgi:hypothetical protein
MARAGPPRAGKQECLRYWTSGSQPVQAAALSSLTLRGDAGYKEVVAGLRTLLQAEAGRMAEVYVSTDVETDGPIPGPHSMLSLGSAAYLADKTLVSTFTVNLDMLPGASGHEKSMAFWRQHPQAWGACRKDPQPPETAMPRYAEWLRGLPGKPVFVGYPAAFDFMFTYWYLIRFVGESPFSHSALDIKTFAMAILKMGYRDSTKANMPKRWFDALPHTHAALDDALEQGALFCNMLAEHLRRE